MLVEQSAAVNRSNIKCLVIKATNILSLSSGDTLQVDVEKFWADGFLIIKGALPAPLVQRWRDAALLSGNADLLSDDILQEVVLHPVIRNVAEQILSGPITYFGDSAALKGPSHGWGFHKDNSDREDAQAPDWQTKQYPIIRFGVYTQSHGNLPGGLDLLRGSHNFPDVTSGDWVAAHIEPGDLVVWNGRTTHSGNSKITRFGVRIDPRLSTVTSRILNSCTRFPILTRQHPKERVAIFLSYARRGPLLDRHLDYLKSREYMVKWWKNSSWSRNTRAMMSESGLDAIDVTAYDHDGRKLNKDYSPIPY